MVVRNRSAFVISGVIVSGAIVAASTVPLAAQPASEALPKAAFEQGLSSAKPAPEDQAAQPGAESATARPNSESQIDARFHISQMERLLEGAVEHGAKRIHQRLQAIVPAEMLAGENARARGFRLDGYGVFFDVEVPTMQASILATLRTLDQNDLGLDTAFRTLKEHVDRARDTNLQQALRRIELQLAPINAALGLPAQALPGPRPAPNAAASTAASTPGEEKPSIDPILRDPNEAYRAEVQTQIMAAMLDQAQIAIGPDEWLVVGARRRDNDRPAFAPADTDAGTMVIRIRGRDLAALRAGRLSRDEALKAMDVQVF